MWRCVHEGPAAMHGGRMFGSSVPDYGTDSKKQQQENIAGFPFERDDSDGRSRT
jgi:hypothetical protein